MHHLSEYWLSYSLVSITLRLPLLNSVHQLSSTRVQVNDLSSGGETPRNIIHQFRYRDLLLQMLTLLIFLFALKKIRRQHAIQRHIMDILCRQKAQQTVQMCEHQ